MKQLKLSVMAMAIGIFVLMFASVGAAVTFDSASGTGFVGKGDVQSVFEWNNKALQDNAGSVKFQVSSVEETTWECSRPHPSQPGQEIIQERSTSTTTHGLLSHVERERNQITGFILVGYDGDPTVVVDGDAIGSCPANPSGFELVEDSIETTQLGGGVQVSINGTDWFDL